MRNLRIARRSATAVGAFALVAGSLGAAPAATAATASPSVSVSASVSQFDATISYTINRKAAYITSQTCLLTNLDTDAVTSTPCDSTANKGSTGKLSKFAVTIEITDASRYSFTVQATVADSSTPASASAAFTIAPGPAVKFEVSGLVNQSIVAGAGEPFAYQVFSVKALDQYDNLATGYTGTVHFDGGDFTWPASPGVPGTTLPADSTLSGGRGVFSMNAGGLQEDCRYYGGILSSECEGYMRVTATDTVNPAITGYQRFYTTIIVPTPNIYYTPDAGVCTSCIMDPSNTLQIDTTKPIQGQILDLSGTTATLRIVGTTVQGGQFNQTITTDALTGTSGDLSNTLVIPDVGQTVDVQLVVTGNPYGNISFDSVDVYNPYTGTSTSVSGAAYMDQFFPPVCNIFGAYVETGCI